MLTKNIYYQEERKYANDRFLVLVVLTLFAFVFSEQGSKEMIEKSMLSGFILLALTLFSILHYYFIATFPSALVALRKNLLIFLDLAVLTYLIIVFENAGLFLLPLYILIVMRSGSSFGISFFYSSLLFAVLSWATLLIYSPYWLAHYDIVATFAVTTFLIPLFYLRIITEIHAENHELTQTLNEVTYDANYDDLTGAANRKQYKEKMMEMLRNKEAFSLLFIDLNKFKAINDTHGHYAGDEILKEVARRILDNIERDDFFARLGGDEFVIITTRKKAYMKKFVAKLEHNVIGRHRVGNLFIPIELSIGISFYPEDSQSAMFLARYADEAMYKAKKDPHRYYYFYQELREEDKL